MILFSKCEGGRVYFAMAISVPLRRKRRPIAPHELKLKTRSFDTF